jgi:hypothetical protein
VILLDLKVVVNLAVVVHRALIVLVMLVVIIVVVVAANLRFHLVSQKFSLMHGVLERLRPDLLVVVVHLMEVLVPS